MKLYPVPYLIIENPTSDRGYASDSSILRLRKLRGRLRNAWHRSLIWIYALLRLSRFRLGILLLFFCLSQFSKLLLHQLHLIEIIEPQHVHSPFAPLRLFFVLFGSQKLCGDLLLSLKLRIQLFHGLVAVPLRHRLDLLFIVLVLVLIDYNLGPLLISLSDRLIIRSFPLISLALSQKGLDKLEKGAVWAHRVTQFLNNFDLTSSRVFFFKFVGLTNVRGVLVEHVELPMFVL